MGEREEKDVSSLTAFLRLDAIYVYVAQRSVMVFIKLGHIFTKVRKSGSIKNKARFIGWIIGCIIISKIKFSWPRDHMKSVNNF